MPRGQSIRGRAGARHERSRNRCTRIVNGVPRRRGPVTDQDRVFLVVALFALAFVALATGIALLVARRRAKLRAPLAGALTFSLVCIAVIMRYALPAAGDDLSVTSMLPFIGGGLVIGCVLIYFSLIKSD